jgi:hypothetical protein
MLTVSALRLFNFKPRSILNDFIISGSGAWPSSYNNAFDGDYSTYTATYENKKSNCYVQADFHENFLAKLTRIRFYPRFEYSSYMKGGYFSTSTDGITFKVLREISSLQEGWNTIDITEDIYARYIRYYGPPSSYCHVAELEYEGIIVGTSEECKITADISVRSEYEDSTSSSLISNLLFQYDISKTPVIHSVSPLYGTALGGTIVTILVKNFLLVLKMYLLD